MKFKIWLESGKQNIYNPLYHGTAGDFNTFDLSLAGERDFGDFGLGFYLTPSDRLARSYAYDAAKRTNKDPIILVVYHKLTNPFDFDDPDNLRRISDATGTIFPKPLISGEKQTRPKTESQAISNYLMSQGYDCGIGRHAMEIVAYDPTKLTISDRRSVEDS